MIEKVMFILMTFCEKLGSLLISSSICLSALYLDILSKNQEKEMQDQDIISLLKE